MELIGKHAITRRDGTDARLESRDECDLPHDSSLEVERAKRLLAEPGVVVLQPGVHDVRNAFEVDDVLERQPLLTCGDEKLLRNIGVHREPPDDRLAWFVALVFGVLAGVRLEINPRLRSSTPISTGPTM